MLFHFPDRRRLAVSPRLVIERLERRVLLGYASGVTYAAGDGAGGLVIDDFNQDTKLDVATANFLTGSSSSASVLLGNGDGTLQAKVEYPTADGATNITSGYFNADSYPDLAVTGGNAAKVSILINNGNGTFAAKVDYATGNWPDGVICGDFNGDLKTDLAVANGDDDTVSILLGNGDGTFGAKTDYATGGRPVDVVAADLNGDLKLDLVLASRDDDTVSVLLGNGNGTFQAKSDYGTGDHPRGLAIGDFNADAKLDIAVANGWDGSVSVLLGNGNGTLQARTDYSVGGSAAAPTGICVVDANKDGNPDIVVADNQVSANVSVLYGLGDGTFLEKRTSPLSVGPSAVASGDLNGDTWPDLVVASNVGDSVAVLLFDGSNDAPDAVDDTARTDEDMAVVISVLSNDHDPDWGDSLSVAAVTQPAHGAVVMNPDNTVTYSPAADWSGTDQFTYTAEDSHGAQETATVTVTVDSVNDAPVATDDDFSVNEDTPISLDVLFNDDDPDGEDPTVLSVTQPLHGSTAINPDYTIQYTPEADWFGDVTFNYTIEDGLGATDTAQVSLTVKPINDSPVAVDDATTIAEDTHTDYNVVANDTDTENQTLGLIDVVGALHGTVSYIGTTITYTPYADWHGQEVLTYTVQDTQLGSDTATFTITVTPVPDSPDADDDAASTNEDVAVDINVAANDDDPDVGDTFTVVSVTQPGHGTTQVKSATTVTYTPAADWWGSDSFTYTIQDSTGRQDTATVSVTVFGQNDAPVAADDTATTANDTPVDIQVTSNDTDVDTSDFVTVVSVSHPAHGTATINPNGTVKYTPTAAYVGQDSFTYTIEDGSHAQDTATVTVSVTPPNTPPDAQDDAASTNEETPVDVNVLANDSDADPGDTISIANLGTALHGTIVLNPDNTIKYTPDANWAGTDYFAYAIHDSFGATDTADVTVTVTNTNDAPTAVDDTAGTAEDAAVDINVLGNDTDPDLPYGDLLTVVGVTQPAHGAASINPNGTVKYTPAADWSGTDAFDYTIQDAVAVQSTATVTVFVAPVNDTPVASDDTATTPRDTPVTIPVLANDTDADIPFGDTMTVYASGPGAHGTTAVVGGTSVLYTPNAGYVGNDTFTYSMRDSAGWDDSATVTVTVTEPWTPVIVGDGGAKQLVFNDPDGTTVTVKQKTGTATVYLLGDALNPVNSSKGTTVAEPAEIAKIELTNTGDASALTLTTKGGADGRTSVGQIVGDAAAGKLSAKGVELDGAGIALTGTGWFSSIDLYGLAGGADVEMAGAGTDKGVTMKIRSVGDDSDFMLNTGIASLTTSYLGDCNIQAPWAGKVSVKANTKLGLDGDCLASFDLTDKDANGFSLNSLTVANEMGDTNVSLAHAGKSIKAAGWSGSLDADSVDSITTKANSKTGAQGDFNVVVSLHGDEVDAGKPALNKLTVAGNLDGSNVNVLGAVNTIKGTKWETGGLSAWSLNSLTLTANKKTGDSGNLGVDIDLTGDGVAAGQTALNNLSVGDRISAAMIRVGGSVGTVTAGIMENTKLYVGFNPDNASTPLAGGTFTAGLSIKSVSTKGIKTSPDPSFFNSVVAASDIGSIKLNTVDTNNSGVRFGVLADVSIQAVSIKAPSWKWDKNGGDDQGTGDFGAVIV